MVIYFRRLPTTRGSYLHLQTHTIPTLDPLVWDEGEASSLSFLACSPPTRCQINVLMADFAIIERSRPRRISRARRSSPTLSQSVKETLIVASEKEGDVKVRCCFLVASRQVDLFQDLPVHLELHPRPPPVRPRIGEPLCVVGREWVHRTDREACYRTLQDPTSQGGRRWLPSG